MRSFASVLLALFFLGSSRPSINRLRASMSSLFGRRQAKARSTWACASLVSPFFWVRGPSVDGRRWRPQQHARICNQLRVVNTICTAMLLSKLTSEQKISLMKSNTEEKSHFTKQFLQSEQKRESVCPCGQRPAASERIQRRRPRPGAPC